MATIAPDDLARLNFPIETDEAKKFWASQHRCNRAKSIIAFSLNLENANDNLRRWNFRRHFRRRALAAFGQYVAQPAMTGIPFSEMEDLWWDEMPYPGDL